MIMFALLAQVTVQMPAGGIPQDVPPTSFTCTLMAGDGSHFTLAGTTPPFAKGWDPNRSKPLRVQSSHAEAFQGIVSIDPGDAGEWFRDFQVSHSTRNDVRYTVQLKLRRDGTSVAFTTRYQSTGKPIPYDYHAAGPCKADFAPAPPAERG